MIEFLDSNPQGIDAPVKEILKRLEDYKPLGADAWPRSPRGLGDALRRAAPALRLLGIECKSAGNFGGKVYWALRRIAGVKDASAADAQDTADTCAFEPVESVL